MFNWLIGLSDWMYGLVKAEVKDDETDSGCCEISGALISKVDKFFGVPIITRVVCDTNGSFYGDTADAVLDMLSECCDCGKVTTYGSDDIFLFYWLDYNLRDAIDMFMNYNSTVFSMESDFIITYESKRIHFCSPNDDPGVYCKKTMVAYDRSICKFVKTQ
jgi:hypothetical protein